MLVNWIIGTLVILVILSLVIGWLTRKRTFYWVALALGVGLLGLFVLIAVALSAM